MNSTLTSQMMEVTYECCGAVYLFELLLPATGTLLHNSALAETGIAYTDAQHDKDHPECEEE